MPRYVDAKYYLCRHCHDLSYESRQKWDKRVALYRRHPVLAMAVLRTGSATQALPAIKPMLSERMLGLG